MHPNYCWRKSPTQQSFIYNPIEKNSYAIDEPGTYLEIYLQRAVNRQPSYRARDCWVGYLRVNFVLLIELLYVSFYSDLNFIQMSEHLLNSSSRGNLVDGLPRAASVYLNSNSGALGVPHGGSGSKLFNVFWRELKKLMKSNISFFWDQFNPKLHVMKYWFAPEIIQIYGI